MDKSLYEKLKERLPVYFDEELALHKAIRNAMPYEDSVNIKLDHITELLEREQTAHWILKRDNVGVYYECSECGAYRSEKDLVCPSCKKKMWNGE